MSRDRAGRLLGLLPIDGATIKPVIDDWGRTPLPYVQNGETIYPTAYRAKGQGAAIAIAKVGAIAGPVVGGFLMAAHVPTAALLYATALTVLIGACLAYPFALLYRRNFDSGSHA